jgi:hypothetical protein
MAFEAQDLMMDVFPERDSWQIGRCDAPTATPQPPCKPPSVKAFPEEGVQLPPLAALREQLHQALHP